MAPFFTLISIASAMMEFDRATASHQRQKGSPFTAIIVTFCSSDSGPA
jgi:hypothetical protein